MIRKSILWVTLLVIGGTFSIAYTLAAPAPAPGSMNPQELEFVNLRNEYLDKFKPLFKLPVIICIAPVVRSMIM